MSSGANALTDADAIAAIRLVNRHLPTAVLAPEQRTVRDLVKCSDSLPLFFCAFAEILMYALYASLALTSCATPQDLQCCS